MKSNPPRLTNPGTCGGDVVQGHSVALGLAREETLTATTAECLRLLHQTLGDAAVGGSTKATKASKASAASADTAADGNRRAAAPPPPPLPRALVPLLHTMLAYGLPPAAATPTTTASVPQPAPSSASGPAAKGGYVPPHLRARGSVSHGSSDDDRPAGRGAGSGGSTSGCSDSDAGGPESKAAKVRVSW
jgi:hypothetical protein